MFNNKTNHSLSSLPRERAADLVLILSVIKLLLIIFLRVGVLLVQLGSIPTKNIYNILIQNIVDFCVTLKCYSLCGITLFCGNSRIYGIVGFGISLNDNELNMNDVITGYSTVILASSIVTIFCSGRLHIFSTIVSAIMLSGIIIPVILHMTWQKTGWTQNKNILGHNVNYIDHSGASIHVSSAIIGFIGASFLGRRLINLKDIDESSIGADSPASTSFGYFLVLLGLISFSFPRHINVNVDLAQAISMILINNLMAMSSAMLTTIVLQLFCYKQQFNYWNIMSCIQGGVAGLVMISAGVQIYVPFMSFVLGIIAGLQFFLMSNIIFATSIEDYCHILAVHFFCGFLGVLFPALLGSSNIMGYKTTWSDLGVNLFWQFICIVFIIILISPIFILVFFLLWGTGFLRNKDDAACHNNTLQLEHGLKIHCMRRFFSIYDDTIFIEPGMSGRTPLDNAHLSTETIKTAPMNVEQLNPSDKHVEPQIQDQYKKVVQSKAIKLPTISEISQNYLQQNPIQKYVNQHAKKVDEHPPKLEELFRAPRKRNNDNNQHPVIKDIWSSSKGGGDMSQTDNSLISKRYEYNIVQALERRKIQRERLHLSLNVHRTNKDANLSKLKRDKKIRNSIAGFNIKSNRVLTLSRSSLTVDKVHNDGFTTIKMPPQKNTVLSFHHF